MVLICKDPSHEHASTIRGRREGPETVGFFAEATAFAEIVDNST